MSVSNSGWGLVLLTRNNDNSSCSVNHFNEIFLNFDLVRVIFSNFNLESAKASLIVNKNWKKVISNAIKCNVFFVQLQVKNFFSSYVAGVELSTFLNKINEENDLEDITITKLKVIYLDFIKMMSDRLMNVDKEKWVLLRKDVLAKTVFFPKEIKLAIRRMMCVTEASKFRNKALERDNNNSIKDPKFLTIVINKFLFGNDINQAAEVYQEAYGSEHDWTIFQNMISHFLSSDTPNLRIVEEMAIKISNEFVKYEALLKIAEVAKKQEQMDCEKRIQSYFKQICEKLIRERQHAFVYKDDDKYLNQAATVAKSILDPILKKKLLDEVSETRRELTLLKTKWKIEDFFDKLRFW